MEALRVGWRNSTTPLSRYPSEKMKTLNQKSNQLHAVSRIQQGLQSEPSVKTLRSPLSAEIWRHCVLRGGAQRRALPRHQSEKIKV